MLERPDPPWLPGHWAPDMIEHAGAVSLLGRSGEPSRRATFEELAEVEVLAHALHGVGGPPPPAAVAEWRHGRWGDPAG
jgi:hypothetical protein